MDGNIIDLRGYLADRASHFAVWGGEGKRARFALPLWRAAALAQARRAGLLKRPKAEEEVVQGPTLVTEAPTDGLDRLRLIDETEPVFVLDLGANDARTDFDSSAIPAGIDPPLIFEDAKSIVVALGTRGAFDWFLVLDTPGEPAQPLDGSAREQLLFFAGECAGLLEQQGIAREFEEDPANDSQEE